MKKLFLLLFILLFPLITQAATGSDWDSEYDWDSFDSSCFLKTANMSNVKQGTVKVEIQKENNFLLIQDKKFLPNKVFSYGQEKYLDYQIFSIKGIGKEALKYESYLNDGNLQTGLYFDPYSREKREMLVDLGVVLNANSFSFIFNHKGTFVPHFFISKDNLGFIEVRNVEKYDFRYLKIIFDEYDSKVNDKNLSIQELGFLKSGDHTYLVKTNSSEPVLLYADYRCEDGEKVRQLVNFVQNKTRNTIFSINSNTEKYSLSFTDNPFYNSDIDKDLIDNEKDNCPFTYNKDQSDVDSDLIGDVCDLDNAVKNFYEKDRDGDGLGDISDNCPNVYNPQQIDSNADKRGDLCADDDGDGVIGYRDNCISTPNADQRDVNVNLVGDACEFDKDKDEIFDSVDNCITISNYEQIDVDNDGIGDECDNCELYNPRQIDKNHNGMGDRCEEEEKYKKENDEDGDGVLDAKDNCVAVFNTLQFDKDKDGVGDSCDNCPELQNKKQEDLNENGIGDFCEDEDGDKIVGYLDNCPVHENFDQSDVDNDGVGDVCEDDDKDGVVFSDDNCPYDSNRRQMDIDGDGVGDKCDDKDDRFIESNKEMFFIFVIAITIVFSVLIFFMIKKIKRNDEEESFPKDEDIKEEEK